MNREKLALFQYWPQLITLIVILAAYIGYQYFAYYNTRSNDAYVSANIINMAALVAGPVSKIYVKENQRVKKGDKLLEIEKRPYLYAMQKAKAAYNIAKITYENQNLAITVAEEKLNQSQSALALSQDHLKRYQSLLKNGDMPKILVINIETRIKEQEAEVIADNLELKMAQQNFDDNAIQSALALYNEAKYLYENTSITAPADGFVTNFNLRKGQYITTGDGLFALVETHRWWVVTRYRETAIRLIKPGDKAKITIDMYPGKVFHGHVKSIGWGINRVQTGNVTPSTLVYLEPTEDWIKIAQRFPVRIYIDDVSPDYPLRIGASATTTTYR